ncbi:hypothetical protein G9A89_010652 [Geosiphon pyriformis]|nr:hypothetical protein G9A89_010652 [Geosiphon pyriformis]
MDILQDDFITIEEAKKRKRPSKFGSCGECRQPRTGNHWCQPCNARRLAAAFPNWTSGNRKIDEFIQHTQLTATNKNELLQWIDFNRLDGIQKLGTGGYGTVYKANCNFGRSSNWQVIHNRWQRDSRLIVVALKTLLTTEENDQEILDETSLIIQSIKVHLRAFQCHGLTRNPTTKQYLMVIQYVSGVPKNNIRNYLNRGFEDLKWKNRIVNLLYIISDLKVLHQVGLVHGDLNSGNLLVHGTALSGMKGKKQEAKINHEDTTEVKKEVRGVMPYVAPEVLEGHTYTQAADIYSFGILMWESTSGGERPFCDVPHDAQLAMSICDGLRPKIVEGTPRLFVELMKCCWDPDYLNRPTAEEVFEILLGWDEDLRNDNTTAEIYIQFEEAERTRELEKAKKIPPPPKKPTHPLAVYHSRLLSVVLIPNSGRVNGRIETIYFDSEASEDPEPFLQDDTLNHLQPAKSVSSQASVYRSGHSKGSSISLSNRIQTIYFDAESPVEDDIPTPQSRSRSKWKRPGEGDVPPLPIPPIVIEAVILKDENPVVEDSLISLSPSENLSVPSEYSGSQKSEDAIACKGKESDYAKKFSCESLRELGSVVSKKPYRSKSYSPVNRRSIPTPKRSYQMCKSIAHVPPTITVVNTEDIKKNEQPSEWVQEMVSSLEIAREDKTDTTNSTELIDEKASVPSISSESENAKKLPDTPSSLQDQDTEFELLTNSKPKRSRRFKFVRRIIKKFWPRRLFRCGARNKPYTNEDLEEW